MDKDKSLRKGIISGIFATIIFLFILEPLMKLMWKFLNSTSSKLYTSYLDSIFSNAAIGHRNHLDLLTLIFIIAMIFISLYYLWIKIYAFIRELKLVEERKALTIDELEERLVSLNSRLFQKIKTLKILFIVGVVSNSLIMLIFLSTLFKEYANLQLNCTYNQRISVISPYVDEITIKKLNSKWALMKTKSDYIEIKLQIEKIAEINSIELPVELIKY